MSGDGLDEAAKAFDADIAREAPPTPKQSVPTPAGRKPDLTEGPPDRLFERVGELEVDEDSPPKGGGDDYPDSEVRTENPPEEEEDEDEFDDEEDEDEGDEENSDFLSQEVNVVVDGNEQSVTLKEALEGYVRTATFHRRMNEVEEAKKLISKTAQDAVANYQNSIQLAQAINAHLEALVPAEPNWDEEFQKNPTRAREVQKYYDKVREFRANLGQQLREAVEYNQKSSAVQVSAFAEAEARKFDSQNAKYWSADPKRKAKDLNAMRRTALTHGFSEEEISQVYDSRMLQILLKASKYDRIVASRPKPVTTLKGKPVPSGTGSARTRKSNGQFSTAMKTLHKTGRVQDAALVFDEILKRERPRKP